MHRIDDFRGKRILVTNDDGIHAPGLAVLAGIARELSDDVWIVAPEVEQSGAGHSLSIHNPLRAAKYEERKFSVRGTPTDCVLYAVESLLPQNGRKPDLILSGINRGHNLGEDVTHSGTIAATMEGTLCGIPSIAFSQSFAMWDAAALPSWHLAEKHGAEIVRRVMGQGLPPMVLMNVNFPNVPAGQDTKGIRMARQGRRPQGKQLEERFDRMKRPYYWVSWGEDGQAFEAGTDLALSAEGYITLTPIRMDLTDHALLESMRKALER